jgi:hypothetical protein
LDHETESWVLQGIAQLRGRQLIVHDRSPALDRAGVRSLFLLRDGRLQDEGTFDELAERHEDLRGSDLSRRGLFGIA